MQPSTTDTSRKPLVHSVKDALHDVPRRLHNTHEDSDETSSSHVAAQPQDSLPVYRREARSNVTIDPNISYETADDTQLRDLAYYMTGTDGHIAYPQPTLVMGPKGHDITLPEREALVQRYLDELESLTAAAPAGGYPPHSAQLFKTAELLKTNIVLTDVKAPAVAASKEYLEKIKELTAIHGRMVEREREIAGRQLGGDQKA